MKVKDVMHQGICHVLPGAPIGQLATQMHDEDIGAVLVTDDQRLLGIVTDRDLTCRVLADGRDASILTARDVMTEPVATCQDDDDLESAIKTMERRTIRRLAVMDVNKRVVGMLSLGDISDKAPPNLAGELARSVSAHHV